MYHYGVFCQILKYRVTKLSSVLMDLREAPRRHKNQETKMNPATLGRFTASDSYPGIRIIFMVRKN